MKTFLVEWAGIKDEKLVEGSKEVLAVSNVAACTRIVQQLKKDGIRPYRVSPKELVTA